ncbi:MAG TPA: pyridoxal 5'-phosphate synthase glutaminase subunit PdxT [Candidatus Acidoferrales bacterium]|nr:pyridoxal 5'-phosphate synthase glutaminase subunit PdxT [Candidatus Acidoferrales bacterium]
MKIGILALQGDFEAHARVLQQLGVDFMFVRAPEDLEGLDGLILPGGESTTHMKLLAETGLEEGIRKMAAGGGAFFGTCAGAILLAREVEGPAQESLGLIDMTVVRNAYGRQLSSDVLTLETKLRSEPLEMVFIRAPVIEKTGRGVDILAEREGRPVLVQQGRVLAATFHPELTSDPAIHEKFLQLANGAGHLQSASAERKNMTPAKKKRQRESKR